MSRTQAALIIGCGSGRCGTVSLAKLLDGCEGVTCTHELRPLLPWRIDEHLLEERVRFFQAAGTPFIGDVAYFYLPYLEGFIDAFHRLRIICLERERSEVIDSFMWWTHWQNRWQDHDGREWVKNEIWDVTYPKYEVATKAEAIGAYWDEYHQRIGHLAARYPDQVGIFDVEALNSEAGRDSILDHAGVPSEQRRHPAESRHHTRQRAPRPASREEAFAWMKQLSQAAEEVSALIPPDEPFILVDEQQLGDHVIGGRRVWPFLERNGQYWGPPPNDEVAISELERLRVSGARFIVFGWPAFWWLEHYEELREHLQASYRRALSNERLVVFDLESRSSG